MRATMNAQEPLSPAAIPATLQRALQHHERGALDAAAALYRQILQADPQHADALHLLGVLALQQGRLDEAVQLISQAVARRPADNYLCNLGNALKAQGRLADAVAAYRQALALNPRMQQALGNLGDALLQLGLADEAAAVCRQAVALAPGAAELHANLGNALLRQGQVPEALASYQHALHLQPRWPLLHRLLGDALLAHGDAAQALQAYGQAQALGLDDAELHRRSGEAAWLLGDVGLAVEAQLQALQRSDTAACRQSFVQAVRRAHFQAPHVAARAMLLRALREAWCEVSELLTPATSLIEAEPALQAALSGAGALTPQQEAALAADGLLMSLLPLDALNSVLLERLLTRLRRQWLLQGTTAADHTLRAALALQCGINDHVYACAADEHEALHALRERLLATVQAGSPAPAEHDLLLLACYEPLDRIAGAARWAELPWPSAVAAVLRQQVQEPAERAALAAAMPRLTPVADAVSLRVQAQYEIHPYPQWTRPPPGPAAVPFDDWRALRFPGSAHPARARQAQVLVAGCGTGQHAVQVAQRYRDAQVLAVDLSLTSLAYAQRMTEQLNRQRPTTDALRICYAQADILQLGTLQDRYDLIESAGVLHHLHDPLAGWRVLRGLLQPRGLMFVALYSELARRDVVAARQHLADQGWTGSVASDDDIRACRQALMQGDGQSGGQGDGAAKFQHLMATRDFHSTSACRDLLFHVQEQRYTLPRLKQELAALGLRFLGFEIDAVTAAAYTQRFPEDTERTNLDHWHVFETEHPGTFERMYALWAQADDAA